MTLLAPWALWFALTGAAIVGLYLLKTRLRRQPVPDLELWLKLMGRTQVRSLIQRLRRWLSLLLWLTIAACLVLALGNPILTVGSVKPQAIAIILDNSASMQAVEKDERQAEMTRLALALEALDELTTRRPVDDEWLLIEAGRRPRVLAGWTRNGGEVREAAAGLRPHLGASDLLAAHALAMQLLEGKERPAVVVMSDGGEQTERLLKDERVVYWPIGSTRENLGITQLAVRAHRQLTNHHVYVAVHNAGASEVHTRLVFEVDGRTEAVEPLEVAAERDWEKVVVLSAPEGGVLRVFHEQRDALAADDAAFAILEPLRSARVLLVTEPRAAFFFEQAMAAMEPLIDVEESRTVSPEEYERLDLSAAAPDLILFNQFAPKALPASGAFVFVGSLPPEAGARVIGQLEHPVLSLSRRDHPLNRYLSVNGATVARATEVDVTDRATVLVTAAGGPPLIFLCRQPGRDLLCLAFDVLETDLPFRNAFPILLRNAVSYLVDEQRAWIHPSYAVGEMISPLRTLPSDVRSVVVSRPTEQSEADENVAVTKGEFAYDRTERIGPLRFSIGTDTAYTSVNLSNLAETRIGPLAAEVDPTQRLALSRRLFGVIPWIGLAALATLLIGLEWLTYHFRWTE